MRNNIDNVRGDARPSLFYALIVAVIALALYVGTAHADEIDTIRVDLPATSTQPEHARLLYGCITHHTSTYLAANCYSSFIAYDGIAAVPANAPMIDFSVISRNFEYFAMNSGPCALIAETTGTFGEAQYWLNCGDVIMRDGFESQP